MKSKHFLKVLSPIYRVLKYSSSSTTPVRVRFAPSPTGSPHLGGLRTALYNYLFAVKHKGSFILRIEDTDQARAVPGAISELESTLTWAGIIPDEGPSTGGQFGPYIQSQRKHIYQEYVQHLIETGAAYRCFCTENCLHIMRKEALRTGHVPRYDNRCRHLTHSEIQDFLSKGAPFVVRFKLEDGPLTFNDLIYGSITHDTAAGEGDPIILKSDGFPTYHLACIVDDHLMGITHVLRGVEWQISTPKHLMLYKAFRWTPPVFAHLPLIVNNDGTKLSKRHGDTTVEYFKKQGYFPEAVMNFLCTMGGGFGKEEECKILCMEDLANKFNLDKVNVNSCRLDFRKLDQYNHRHLVDLIEDKQQTTKLVAHTRSLASEIFGDSLKTTSAQGNLNDEQIKKYIEMSKDRINKLADIVTPSLEFLWIPPKTTALQVLKPSSALILKDVATKVKGLFQGDFQNEKLNDVFKTYCKEKDLKYKEFMHMLRIALSGLKEGPKVVEMFMFLGQESSVQRLEDAAKILSKQTS